MTVKRAMGRAALAGVLAAIAVVATGGQAAANQYVPGCLIYPGVVWGEDTYTTGCPQDVRVECDLGCDEIKQFVTPLVYYVADSKEYVLERVCNEAPAVCG